MANSPIITGIRPLVGFFAASLLIAQVLPSAFRGINNFMKERERLYHSIEVRESREGNFSRLEEFHGTDLDADGNLEQVYYQLHGIVGGKIIYDKSSLEFQRMQKSYQEFMLKKDKRD